MAQIAYLRNLNPAQLQAVEHLPDIPLQILAGPGSGKTRVLTARIAHLIFHHRILPQAICAVTFTNKAANEMRARLQVLVGRHETGLIRMGTFHALCASFLRRHGSKLNLETNFTICDADESKKIIKKLLEDHTKFLADKNVSLTEGTAMSLISKVKARGETADDLRARHLRMKARQSDGRKRRRPQPLDDDQDEDGGTNPLLQDVNVLEVVADVYKRYERKLRQSNSLDFDDLLLFGVRLFERHPSVGEWCEHVLVDEFQDTNTIQYELMRRIAAASGCVTIVGDPDQSIYGWRSAEVKNLRNMLRDFPQTQQILLEQNYRSTASILGASMAIVAQDKNRVAKTLLATHPIGRRPVLQLHLNEHEEATFIATEIKHLVAATGGMLEWGDFVVLLRFNALSRLIESALQKEGIPNRILGGHKFFERLEVKDLLAYLQLIDNPHFVPAFSRAINVPARGIGEKTVAEILATAERLKLSPLTVVTRIHDGKLPDIKPSVKRKLATFVPPMQKLRKLARERTPPSALIRRLLHLVEFEAHLKKTQKDWDSRVENVQELINFASEVETSEGIAGGVPHDAGERWDVDEDWDVLPEFDLEDERADVDDDAMPREGGRDTAESDTPLRLFLQASMLSTDVAAENKGDGKGKVTLTTCHAAKGLEWPVVFIPAVEDGTFPSHRAEDVNEERRLLYVACTRAQTLLYLTHANSRMFAGETRKKDLSEFVSIALKENQNSFAREAPHLTANLSVGDRALLAKMLGRQTPEEAEVARRLAEQRPRAHAYDPTNLARDGVVPQFMALRQARPASFDGPVNFSSARAVLQQGLDPLPMHEVPQSPPLCPSTVDNISGPSTRPAASNRIFAYFPPSVAQGKEEMRMAQAHGSSRPSNSGTRPLVKPVSSPAPSTGPIPVRTSKPRSERLASKGMPPSVRPSTVHSQIASSSKATSRRASYPSDTIIDLTSDPPEAESERAPVPPRMPRSEPSSNPRSSPATVSPSSSDEQQGSASRVAGTKRRLGMGRTAMGYANKKFKAPALAPGT